MPIEKIGPIDHAVARAVRLAAPAMNSQPPKLEFKDPKGIVKGVGRGSMRAMLGDKLNKTDRGKFMVFVRKALIYTGLPDAMVTQVALIVSSKLVLK